MSMPSLAAEQITMAASIDVLKGVGPAAMEVFRKAGFGTIAQLKAFDGEDRRLLMAIEEIKNQPDITHLLPDYWLRLGSRCINIIYRVQSAEASPFVPDAYMCPISLTWFEDPVVAPSGHSFSRAHILQWLTHNLSNPITRQHLSQDALYPNSYLQEATHHYRLHHQRVSIVD